MGSASSVSGGIDRGLRRAGLSKTADSVAYSKTRVVTRGRVLDLERILPGDLPAHEGLPPPEGSATDGCDTTSIGTPTARGPPGPAPPRAPPLTSAVEGYKSESGDGQPPPPGDALLDDVQEALLCHARITSVRLEELARAYASLSVLALNDNPLGQDGFAVLGRLVADSPALRSLSAARCGAGDTGVAQLAMTGLMATATLRTLDVSGNACGDQGAIALSYALLENPRHPLTRLRLDDNGVGAMGADALGAVLHHDEVRLTSLSLANNDVRTVGALPLLRGLEHMNRCLKRLDLRGNTIGPGASGVLSRALRRNRVLEVLNLSDNPLNDACARDLIAGLRGNHALRRLHLNGTGMSREALMALKGRSAWQAQLHVVAVVPCASGSS